MAGDILLLYTDGITEAANGSGELFGEVRLGELLKELHQLPPQELIDRIFQQVRLFSGSHSFNDDVSLVVLQVMGGEEKDWSGAQP
jgi:serine phosphatase RsbU (regulator of sigma subunit)